MPYKCQARQRFDSTPNMRLKIAEWLAEYGCITSPKTLLRLRAPSLNPPTKHAFALKTLLMIICR